MASPRVDQQKSGYFEACREYSTRTTEYDVLSKWFDDNVARQNDVKSMLYVGLPSEFGLTLALKIKSLAQLTILGVEKAHFDVTELLVSQKTSVEVKYISFEEFVSTSKYDLILFSHVLYYISDRTAALKKAMSMLTSEGRILVFHQTKHGIYQSQKLFNRNNHTYSLNELHQDINATNFLYNTSIVDSMVRIDAPTKKLSDFILGKETSEDEFTQFSSHLNNLEQIVYQPLAIIVIHRPLNEFHINPVETLSRKLLKDSDKVLLGSNELLEIGTILYGNGQGASLYKMCPEQLERDGLQIFARTGIEVLYDPFAIPIFDRVAEVIKHRFPSKSVVAIDPFLGSGNQLYHLAKSTQATDIFGFDNNPRIYEQTVRNFKKLHFNATCWCQDYSAVSNFVQPDSNAQQLFVINLSPPWADGFDHYTGLKLDKTSPPLKSLIQLYQKQFSAVAILFVIIIPEKVEQYSMDELLNLSSFNETFMVNVSDRRTNVGCLILEPKLEECVHRQLPYANYQTAFEDIAARSNVYNVMQNWFTSYLQSSGSKVCKMLCIGPGAANLETMLAKDLSSLTVFHCVESNIHCIQKFWENCKTLSVSDKRLFFTSFEDFQYDGTLYDIILFSHSIYYINNRSLQLVKAKQSLLAENGSILIFHEGTAELPVELQQMDFVHSATYNRIHLENELSHAGIRYTLSSLEIIIDVTHRTQDLLNFFLKRHVNECERKKLKDYFDTIDSNISWSIVAIAIKNSVVC